MKWLGRSDLHDCIEHTLELVVSGKKCNVAADAYVTINAVEIVGGATKG